MDGKMSINILDTVLLLFSIIVIIKVTIRGFIDEFFSMAAFLLAIAVAFWFYRPLSLHTKVSGLSPAAMKLIAFFMMFIVVFIAVKLLQLLISAVFNNEILNSLDHALGFFLGVFEAYIVLIIIIAILQLQPFFNVDELIAHSIVVRVLVPLPIDSDNVLQMIRSGI